MKVICWDINGKNFGQNIQHYIDWEQHTSKKGKVLVSEKQGGIWTTSKVHTSVKYGRKEFSAFSRENED